MLPNDQSDEQTADGMLPHGHSCKMSRQAEIPLGQRERERSNGLDLASGGFSLREGPRFSNLLIAKCVYNS
jgi:hypothetical protein